MNTVAILIVLFVSLYAQSVIRVRKRVTLMVVVVTAIFGICWLMSTVVYNVEFFTASLHIGLTVNGVISDTMVFFNSAVNPFVYALLNRQFKDKMKRIICCTDAAVPRVQTTRGAHEIKLTNHTTYPTHPTHPTNPTHTAGPRFQEWYT